MTDNLPATRDAQPPSQREVIAAARENMLADVESNKGDVTQFLKGFGIDYEFFVSGLKVFLMRQAQTQPDFFTGVKPASFMEALFRCAKDGLIPDGKEAAIAVYKGTATYMPMRDGLVKILWRTGKILDINDQTVTRHEMDADRFDYEEGSSGFIKHRPLLDRKDTDEIVAAYCVINLVNGGSVREVVMRDDLKKIAAMSRSPAMRAWPHQMSRKAAIRRVMGKMPREAAISQVLAHDDDNYDFALLDSNRNPTPSGVADKLAAGAGMDAPGFAHGNVEKALSAPTGDLAMQGLPADLDIPHGDQEAIHETEVQVRGETREAVRSDSDKPPFDALAWATEFEAGLAGWTNPDLLAEEWVDLETSRKLLRATDEPTAKRLHDLVMLHLKDLRASAAKAV